VSVLYYKNSERLALRNIAVTASIDDALRWVLVAPPNHPLKMASARNMVVRDLDRARRIATEIKQDGLQVHSSWKSVLGE
jgi:hypothetical protein